MTGHGGPAIGSAHDDRLAAMALSRESGRTKLLPAKTAEVVPFVDLRPIHLPIVDDLVEALLRVVSNSSFVGGKEVQHFEAGLAAYVGTDHAVGVGSGTAALQLALQAAGIGRGAEVIVPANTFFATVEAVVAAGAEPVLVDAVESTALMNMDAFRAAITPRTEAVIPVHLYGQPVNMDEITVLARQHGLFVLEDAAQAIGARWSGRAAGTWGDAAAFSFYPAKNLGALGDAGAVTTDDGDLAARISALRSHGEHQKGVHDRIGTTARIDGLQAAFLAIKLDRMSEWQEKRDRVVRRYMPGLRSIEGVALFDTDERARHVYHLLVVQVENRDAVIEGLREAGVMVGIHYPRPVHLQPAWTRSRPIEHHPVAERLSLRILSLPLFPTMSNEQVDRAVETLDQVVQGKKGQLS